MSEFKEVRIQKVEPVFKGSQTSEENHKALTLIPKERIIVQK